MYIVHRAVSLRDRLVLSTQLCLANVNIAAECRWKCAIADYIVRIPKFNVIYYDFIYTVLLFTSMPY